MSGVTPEQAAYVTWRLALAVLAFLILASPAIALAPNGET